jgi:glycerate kinase
MRLLIAPDSFKDALSAEGIAKAFSKGVNQTAPEWECILLPLADGGEGTAAIMTNALGGKLISFNTVDPLLRPITATAGWIARSKTGIVELAAASGLALLQPSERNPLYTSTYGTGLIIAQLLDMGMQELYLTLGGSATNDMGIGMAAALGFQFISDNHIVGQPRGADLLTIHSINASDIHPGLKDLKVTVLCDVNNPLYGANGAAHMYGRQKGADEATIHLLDSGLRGMAKLVLEKINKDVAHIPGSGAAGGCGAGALAFLNGKLTPGIDAILQLSGFEEKLQLSDLVVTGEGSIDLQTFTGKVVKGVTNICRRHRKPVIGICGVLQLDFREVQDLGLAAAFQISNGVSSLDKAIAETADNVERIAANLTGMMQAIINRYKKEH